MSLRVPALLLLAAVSACSSASKPAEPAVAVYLQVDNGVKRLFGTPEDGRSGPVALSPAGERAAFGGVVSGRRVVYGTLAADASVTSLRRVGVDGSADTLLASFPAGKYAALRGAWEASGRIVVQVTLPNGSPELLVTDGASMKTLAGGRWAGTAGDRVVYLANATSAARQVGDVRTVKVDGSGDVALGGGDADDLLHGIQGSAIFLTQRSSGSPELHAVNADGSGRATRAGSLGLLFSEGRMVASREGKLERLGRDMAATALAFPEGAATPLALRADGTVIAHVAGKGVIAADGQSSRTLDTFSAGVIHQARIESTPAGERIFFTANNADGSFLRSAAMDGTGALTIATGKYQEVLFSGFHGGRALYFRTQGREVGGRLETVGFDGSNARPIGDATTRTSGAADHDFGSLSRAGRLVFEAELIEHDPPRLYVTDAQGSVRALTPSAGYATMQALVE